MRTLDWPELHGEMFGYHDRWREEADALRPPSRVSFEVAAPPWQDDNRVVVEGVLANPGPEVQIAMCFMHGLYVQVSGDDLRPIPHQGLPAPAASPAAMAPPAAPPPPMRVTIPAETRVRYSMGVGLGSYEYEQGGDRKSVV